MYLLIIRMRFIYFLKKHHNIYYDALVTWKMIEYTALCLFYEAVIVMAILYVRYIFYFYYFITVP